MPPFSVERKLHNLSTGSKLGEVQLEVLERRTRKDIPFFVLVFKHGVSQAIMFFVPQSFVSAPRTMIRQESLFDDRLLYDNVVGLF